MTSWDALVTEFLDSTFAARPEIAVNSGRHEFDGQLPDWSEAGLTRERNRLTAWRARLDDIDEYCIEINRLENAADDIYRKAIGRLFENGTSPMDVIKWLDIYDILESATDRCEDVANTLETIGLKNS